MDGAKEDRGIKNELVLNDLLFMYQSQIMEQCIGWVAKGEGRRDQ